MITPAQRMAASLPKWQTEEYADPLALIRQDRTTPVRRSYPQAPANTPAKQPLLTKKIKLKSVGAGFKVYLEPEDGADSGSDEGKHRFRSAKNTGDGTAILMEAADGDEELKFKGIKKGDESEIKVQDDGEAITIEGNGVQATVRVNAGGTMVFKDGLLKSGSEGVLGGEGSLGFFPCGDDAQRVPLFDWTEGQILTSGEVSFRVGNCSTHAPGS